jgi:hypothetical protein
LLQAISGYIKEKTEGQHVLASIRYRNLAPLYCDEEMRICCRVKKSFEAGDVYEVWIEGPTGGVAVMGTVRTVPASVTDIQRKTPKPQADNDTGPYSTDKKQPKNPKTDSKIRRVDSARSKTPAIIDENAAKNGLQIRRIVSPGNNETISATELEVPLSKGLPGLNQVKNAVKVVRSASCDSISPALDPQPRNIQKERTVKFDGFLPAFSSHESQRSSQATQLNLSTFAMPAIPPRHDSTAQASSPKTDVVMDSGQPTPDSDREPRRAYRRNRPTRIKFIQMASPHIRVIEAPPTPMKPTMALKTRNILRRLESSKSKHVVDAIIPSEFSSLLAPPIPLIRRYRGKQYIYNPSDIVSRHSRYMREGARKIYQLPVVRLERSKRRTRR